MDNKVIGDEFSITSEVECIENVDVVFTTGIIVFAKVYMKFVVDECKLVLEFEFEIMGGGDSVIGEFDGHEELFSDSNEFELRLGFDLPGEHSFVTELLTNFMD